MPARPARAFGCATGAVILFLAFLAGAEWSDSYLMQYGIFPLSRGELALKLHSLLFLLPASALAAAAIAEVEPVSRRLLAAFERLGGPPGWVWPLALAVLVAALAALVRSAVLQGAPVTDDENVYLFQARLLAAGHLYVDSLPAPLRPFFDNQFIVNNGRWFGMYFIGHPLVLGGALRTGLIEWVGPVEAGLTLLLGVGIARRVFGERVAVLTGVLLALSPFLIFISATHLSQPTSTLCLMLFVYAELRIEASPRGVARWALAGAALSYFFLTRPQAAIILALPSLVRLGWLLARGSLRPGWAPPASFLAAVLAGATVFLSVNQALTGSPLQTSYHAYWEQVRTINWRTTPLYPFRELGRNLDQLNAWLFGWPVSLAFVPFFARDERAWVLLAIPGLALVAQALAGVPSVAAVGPVYFAESIVPLSILSASGIERVIHWSRERFGETRPTRALVAWPVCLAVVALLTFIPVQIASLSLMADIARAPYDLVEERRLDNALIFVHSLPALRRAPGAWVYYHRNPWPDLRDRVLFARDLGPERNKVLLAHLPDRTPYLMGMQGAELVLLPIQP